MGEGFYDALHEAKATNKAMRVQLYYSRTDSWFEDLIYPSADGISVYYHDITEAKKAEIDLQQAHKKLSYHIAVSYTHLDVYKRQLYKISGKVRLFITTKMAIVYLQMLPPLPSLMNWVIKRGLCL